MPAGRALPTLAGPNGEGVGARCAPHIFRFQTELGTMEICVFPVFNRQPKTFLIIT